jgi:hypothetical protein
MNGRFAAAHESAFGTKRTSNCRLPMSAFGGKADVSYVDPLAGNTVKTLYARARQTVPRAAISDNGKTVARSRAV